MSPERKKTEREKKDTFILILLYHGIKLLNESSLILNRYFSHSWPMKQGSAKTED